jgi:signal peptidase I
MEFRLGKPGWKQFCSMAENKNIEELVGEEAYYGVGSFIWEVVKVFFWALIIIVPIRIFLFQPFFVQGASMEPNFNDGDYLIVNELGYKITDIGSSNIHFFTVGSFRDLGRDDVVVFRYPKNPSQFFIKRVIGLPGEEIKIDGGVVTIINAEHPKGLVLNEDAYLPAGRITNGAIDRTLGPDEYFVMGDNRQFSSDSRAWGTVPKTDIVGKVLLRAWPVSKIGIF